jgi:hypothetical protein
MLKLPNLGKGAVVALAITALIMVQPMTFIPLALAQPQFPPQIPKISAPNTHVANLADMWWQWATNLDTTVVGNPFGDNSLSCTLGEQRGNLLFLTGTAGIFTPEGGVEQPGGTDFTRTCTIQPGTQLLIPLLNTECSTIEFGLTGPCGDTPDELRASANQLLDFVTSLTLEIDGVQVPAEQLFQYRVESANKNGFSLTIAPNNPFGITPEFLNPPTLTLPATATSVAAGYWVLLNPLPPGEHTIEFGGIATFPAAGTFRTSVTYLLNVVPSA